MDSILTSIKKLLGIQEDYTHFDADLVITINSVLAILTQLGVGPEDGSATWVDFIGDTTTLEMVKSFVHLRVRLLFDPPQNASLADAIDRMARELEWRIQVAADPVETT